MENLNDAKETWWWNKEVQIIYIYIYIYREREREREREAYVDVKTLI